MADGSTRASGDDEGVTAEGAWIEFAVAADHEAVEAVSERARRGSLPSGAGPWDVVVANLVASLLVDLAGPLRDEPRPGGALVASGIFLDREADVRVALESAGLAVRERSVEGEWVALVAERSG